MTSNFKPNFWNISTFKILAILFALSMVAGAIFTGSTSVLAQSNTGSEKVLEGVVNSRYTSNCKNSAGTNPEAKCEYVNLILVDGTALPPLLIKNELNEDQVTQVNYKVKDRVIVVQTTKADGTLDYYIRDPDRQIQLWIFAVIILVAAFAIARVKGLLALLALSMSTFVIFALFIPQVLNGGSMIFWGFITTLIILIINQLVGHGFTRISMIGLFSGFLTLIAAWILGSLAVAAFKLTGGAGDSIVFLRSEKGANFDFQGLFLVGTLIGVTGAIDDVVAAQVSSTQEIASSNNALKFGELYAKSFRIGKEHIVSMINTLFLAYAGASLPLLMLFYMNLDQSVTQLMSREDLTEEIVRSGVGSMALLLVVPLSTLCAVLFYKRPKWLEQFLGTGRKNKHHL